MRIVIVVCSCRPAHDRRDRGEDQDGDHAGDEGVRQAAPSDRGNERAHHQDGGDHVTGPSEPMVDARRLHRVQKRRAHEGGGEDAAPLRSREERRHEDRDEDHHEKESVPVGGQEALAERQPTVVRQRVPLGAARSRCHREEPTPGLDVEERAPSRSADMAPYPYTAPDLDVQYPSSGGGDLRVGAPRRSAAFRGC